MVVGNLCTPRADLNCMWIFDFRVLSTPKPHVVQDSIVNVSEDDLEGIHKVDPVLVLSHGFPVAAVQGSQCFSLASQE